LQHVPPQLPRSSACVLNASDFGHEVNTTTPKGSPQTAKPESIFQDGIPTLVGGNERKYGKNIFVVVPPHHLLMPVPSPEPQEMTFDEVVEYFNGTCPKFFGIGGGTSEYFPENFGPWVSKLVPEIIFAAVPSQPIVLCWDGDDLKTKSQKNRERIAKRGFPFTKLIQLVKQQLENYGFKVFCLTQPNTGSPYKLSEKYLDGYNELGTGVIAMPGKVKDLQQTNEGLSDYEQLALKHIWPDYGFGLDEDRPCILTTGGYFLLSLFANNQLKMLAKKLNGECHLKFFLMIFAQYEETFTGLCTRQNPKEAVPRSVTFLEWVFQENLVKEFLKGDLCFEEKKMQM
jgi:hypothetical protein